jgi:hypothetical protein
MNQSSIGKVTVVILFLLLSLYVIVDVLDTPGSSLGRFYLYLAIFSFLAGCVAPRWAFACFILTTGFIDLFKRLIVVYGRPTELDLYFILGVPPLLIAGIILNLLMSFIIGRAQLQRQHIISFAISTVFFGVMLYGAIGGGLRAGRGLGDAVNQGAYAYLFFVIPILLADMEDVLKVFRRMVVIFTIVALYMLKHHFFGLSGFEHDYLLSGISIESRILWENNGALRGFSTMSGAQSVAVFCSCMLIVLWAPIRRLNGMLVPMPLLFRVVLSVLFLYASYATVSRGGWVCGMVAIFAYVILSRKSWAFAGYTVMAGALLALIFGSSWILKNNMLGEAETLLRSMIGNTSDAYAERSIVMGTMTARFEGFVNLTSNPDVWTPFGLKIAGDKLYLEMGPIAYCHDFITEFLIKYGYIAFVSVGGLAIWFFLRINKIYFSLPPQSDFRVISRIALAFAIGIFSGGLGNGAQLWVFPQNFYFYFFLAVIYTIGVKRKFLVQNYHALREERLRNQQPVHSDSPAVA